MPNLTIYLDEIDADVRDKLHTFLAKNKLTYAEFSGIAASKLEIDIPDNRLDVAAPNLIAFFKQLQVNIQLHLSNESKKMHRNANAIAELESKLASEDTHNLPEGVRTQITAKWMQELNELKGIDNSDTRTEFKEKIPRLTGIIGSIEEQFKLLKEASATKQKSDSAPKTLPVTEKLAGKQSPPSPRNASAEVKATSSSTGSHAASTEEQSTRVNEANAAKQQSDSPTKKKAPTEKPAGKQSLSSSSNTAAEVKATTSSTASHATSAVVNHSPRPDNKNSAQLKEINNRLSVLEKTVSQLDLRVIQTNSFLAAVKVIKITCNKPDKADAESLRQQSKELLDKFLKQNQDAIPSDQVAELQNLFDDLSTTYTMPNPELKTLLNSLKIKSLAELDLSNGVFEKHGVDPAVLSSETIITLLKATADKYSKLAEAFLGKAKQADVDITTVSTSDLNHKPARTTTMQNVLGQYRAMSYAFGESTTNSNEHVYACYLLMQELCTPIHSAATAIKHAEDSEKKFNEYERTTMGKLKAKFGLSKVSITNIFLATKAETNTIQRLVAAFKDKNQTAIAIGELHDQQQQAARSQRKSEAQAARPLQK